MFSSVRSMGRERIRRDAGTRGIHVDVLFNVEQYPNEQKMEHIPLEC